MRLSRKGLVALGLVAALGALPACSSKANESGDKASGNKVEVFSWWTGAGEEAGLNAMIEDFKKKNPGVEVINAAVSGGAGTNAKAILANRLAANDAPHSYQRHAGQELADDIKAGSVQDVTYLYEKEGWKDKLPQGLLDSITVGGKIYSVPVNIHRANLLWFVPKTLTDVGISAPPKTWAEFLTQAETIKSKGKTPLSIGPGWTQKHLLETVLLGELGATKYPDLWNGKLSWTSPEVTAALETFKKVMSYSDIKSAAADWQPAADKVLDGTAVYNVMGDWQAGYFAVDKKLEYKKGFDVVASPGSQGVYDFLSDSFTLPTATKDKAASEKWLLECGSVSGQDAFNPKKGSIPARTDADKSKYTGYLADALKEWQDTNTKVVGSLAHGVVANNAWNAEIDTALGLYVQDGDTAKFANAVAKAYTSTR